MSGISARLMYDDCYYKQVDNSNKLQENYSMFLDSYVNSNMENINANTCGYFSLDPSGCSLCDNKEANMTKLPNDFGKRADVENMLWGINKPVSLCNSNKFGGCESNSNNVDCSNNYISVTPWLCDRAIFPTNLKPY